MIKDSFVCVCVMYACMFIRIGVSLFTSERVCVCMCLCVFPCVSVRLFVCVRAWKSMYEYVRMSVCVCLQLPSNQRFMGELPTMG